MPHNDTHAKPHTAPGGNGYRASHLRRYGPVVLAAVIGLAISVLGFQGIRYREAQVIQQEFNSTAKLVFFDTRKSLDRTLLLVEALHSLFDQTENVSREGFHGFMRGTAKYLDGIQALQWIPRIRHEERAAYQARAWAEGLTNYQIMELGPKGKLVPAQNRPEYYPIYYVEPMAGNETVLGFDTVTKAATDEPRFTARDTGELRATSRISLIQETGKQFGIILIKPVYAHKGPLDTIEKRRANLKGFVQLVLRGGDFLEASMINSENRGLAVFMHDMSATGEERFLHAYQAEGMTYEQALTQLHTEYDLDIGGRAWRITCVARPAFIKRFGTNYSALTGVSGLLLTGLLCAYLLSVTGQAEKTKILIELRTAELRQSQERFDLALKGGDLGLWDWNIRTGAVLFDKRWAEMIEYEPQELAPDVSSWAKLVHPDDMKEIVEPALKAHMEGKTPLYSTEHRMKSKSGKWKWILDRGKVVEWDEDGTPLRAVGTHLDITERMNTQLEFASLTERLEMALDASASGLWDWDVTTGHFFFDEQWAALHGYDQSELPQRLETWEKTLHKDDKPAMAARLEQAMRPEFTELFEAEYRAARKTGEWIWILTRGRVMARDQAQAPLRMIGTVQNVTQRKLLEDELRQAKDNADRANQAKSNFLANMSHEIRTPMNAVIGLTDLALTTELTPKQQDYLNKIKFSARSLLGVINDILDFSKIEAGKLSLEQTEFRLLDVMNRIADMFSHRMAEHELTFEVTTNLDLPSTLVGDPMRLEQVLVNLTANALKFTEQGRVTVAAQPAPGVPASNDSAALLFSITDTGIGISEQNQTKLFQSFSQADASTTRKYGGSGLGLAICKKLVDLMGGTMALDSQPGKGSTFSFTLTLPLGKEATERGHSPGGFDGMRALIVDDHETTRDILNDMLQSFGFETELAEDAEHALEILRSQATPPRFDLALLDLKLPGLDGLELARRIKAMDHLPTQPKIILVTGFGRDSALHGPNSAFVDAMMLKPVQQSSLLNSITDTLIDTARPASRKPESLPSASNLGGKRMLLVEDNEINQQVAAEILAGVGITVDIVDNGRKAVARLASNIPYDAVLMDVQMPVMDGYEATRTLRQDPRFADLPIIAMTAHAMTGDREKCLAAGMNDYISKPIDVRELHKILQRWLGMNTTPAAPQAVVPRPPSTLPDTLPGFDLPAALERLGGNAALLHRLLNEFEKDYATFCEDITTSIAAGNREEARRMAHTIKGVAGNIAAADLHRVASELEANLRHDRPHAKSLEVFCEHHALVLRSLATLGKANAQAQEDETGAPETGKAQTARTLLAQLTELIAENSFTAGKTASELRPVLRGLGLEQKIEALETALGKFDFTQARLDLDALENDPAFPRKEKQA